MKPKDLTEFESEECGRGEGGGVYVNLMESDTVEPSGCEGGKTPGRSLIPPNPLKSNMLRNS